MSDTTPSASQDASSVAPASDNGSEPHNSGQPNNGQPDIQPEQSSHAPFQSNGDTHTSDEFQADGVHAGNAVHADGGQTNGEAQKVAEMNHSKSLDHSGPKRAVRQAPLLWLMFNIVIPLILLAGAVGLVVWLGTVDSPARPPIDTTRVGRLKALPSVRVVPVRSLSETGQKLNLTTDGTVVPFREVVLATEVAGQIVEKSPLCEAGRFVNEGDLLMKIDPTDYELEVERLQRLQQQEYESLGEVDQEVVNAGRLIEVADADIELQMRELKRQESLPKDFASRGEVDQAKRALLQAEQQKLGYQNQIDLLKKRRTRLETSEKLAATQLQGARKNLERTEILAPIDGVIVSEQAELNTFVARGSPVVTLEDTSSVEVTTSLRTEQLYWVLNQKDPSGGLNDEILTPQTRGYRLPPTKVKVRYQLSGRDDVTYQWEGELLGYDGIGLDEQTRTVPVRVVVEDPQAFQLLRNGRPIEVKKNGRAMTGPTALVRGMFVVLRFELDPAVPLVVLPAESLKPGNSVWQFVPNDSVLDKPIEAESEAKKVDTAARDEKSDSELEADVPVETLVNEDSQAEDKTLPADKESEDTKPKADDSFQPEAWTAGELVILRNVRPVDRFVAGLELEGEDLVSGADASKDQGWICEVPTGTLGSGSYVVVSPLGSIQQDRFPVRAPSDVAPSEEEADVKAEVAKPAAQSLPSNEESV